jgi:Spy/CpxP family protein refolding chaperone
MIRTRPLISVLAIASALTALALPAQAGEGCGMMGGPGMGQSMGGPGKSMQHREAMRAKHHDKLHAALKLTADQENAWKKLMAAESAMPRPDPARHEAMSKLSTPERADMMLAHMKEREASMTQHVAALKEFYGVLTAEQKVAFDAAHQGQRPAARGQRSKPASAAPAKP